MGIEGVIEKLARASLLPEHREQVDQAQPRILHEVQESIMRIILELQLLLDLFYELFVAFLKILRPIHFHLGRHKDNDRLDAMLCRETFIVFQELPNGLPFICSQ